MKITNIKVPNFKFPKIKMEGIEEIPEVIKVVNEN